MCVSINASDAHILTRVTKANRKLSLFAAVRRQKDVEHSFNFFFRPCAHSLRNECCLSTFYVHRTPSYRIANISHHSYPPENIRSF